MGNEKREFSCKRAPSGSKQDRIGFQPEGIKCPCGHKKRWGVGKGAHGIRKNSRNVSLGKWGKGGGGETQTSTRF